MLLLTTAAMAGEADGSWRHFHHTVQTSAAPEAIWALWTDPQTWPEWDTELTEARLDGEIGLGMTGVLVSGGRASSFAVTEWQPAARYAFTTPLPLGSLVVTRTLSALPDGGTELTHDVQLTGVGGVLLASVLGRQFRAALPGVMAQLVALAESVRSPGRPLRP